MSFDGIMAHNSHEGSAQELGFVKIQQNVNFFCNEVIQKHILNDCCETH